MGKLQETLKELIKESGRTIYSFSNEAQIERTYLTKILSGKRNLTLDKFLMIIDALKVDKKQRYELIEAYIVENFSKSKFEAYSEYLSTAFLCVKEKSTTVTQIESDLIIFDDRRRLLDFAEFFLSEDNFSSRLYTNFPTSTLLLIAQERTNCDFRCILNSETKETAVSVFELIKLSVINCVAYADKNLSVKAKNEFYPYIVISDDGILFANKALDKGYYIRNKAVSDLYADDFCRLLSRMKISSQIYDDILDVKELVQKNMFNKKIHRVVTNNFCAIAFMIHSEFEELARENLPERDYLIDTTYAYYRAFFESSDSHRFIINLEGLTDFCETGIIHEMPLSYSRPLSVETRVNILKRIVSCIKETPSRFSVNFFKGSNFGNLEINLDVESGVSKENEDETSLIVMSADKTQKNYFPGNYLFLSTDKNTNCDFNEYFDLLSISSYVMTKEESLAAIEDRVLRLEYALKSEKDKI